MKAIATNGAEIETGDLVLARDSEFGIWNTLIFSHDTGDSAFNYICGGNSYMFCIPYAGNEHLVGTDNPIPIVEVTLDWGDKCRVRNCEDNDWEDAIFIKYVEDDSIHPYEVLIKGYSVTDTVKECIRAETK